MKKKTALKVKNNVCVTGIPQCSYLTQLMRFLNELKLLCGV